MRPRTTASRAATLAGALTLLTAAPAESDAWAQAATPSTGDDAGAGAAASAGDDAGAGAAAASAGDDARAPEAAASDDDDAQARTTALSVKAKRLHVRSGQRVLVIGAARPAVAGRTAWLQIRSGGAWRTIDRDRTAASGRYVLRTRVRQPRSAPARVRMRGAARRIGRLNVYRWAIASWYGPGLYGSALGCGGSLFAGRLGVAHKTLPCGSRVTLRHRGRTVRVSVIDRGPYVGGREYDLTEATARRLGFRGHGAIMTTR